MEIILKELLTSCTPRKITGDTSIPITGIALDSRKVEKGNLFVAIQGVKQDGHQNIDDAIRRGAVAIVYENDAFPIQESITAILVEDTKSSVGELAHHFYEHPSHKLKLIGVTGTNGKTTVATILYRLFSQLGYSCGLLSTVENIIGTEVQESQLTTPDPVSLNHLLYRMVHSGCTYAFMEVSSHAIHQKRIQGLKFHMGVFTNITHDHLDYHVTFKEYIDVKKSFIDQLPADASVLVNADDTHSKYMVQNTNATVYRYAMHTDAEYKGRLISMDTFGTELSINRNTFITQLIGEYNASNITATFSVAHLLGVPANDICIELSKIRPPAGRLEKVYNTEKTICAFIDYAHTPDALEKVLTTLHEIKKNKSRIITVIGCGGDRDKLKRPLMGKVSVKKSDISIFTSDNPRSEDVNVIIQEMEEQLDEKELLRVFRNANRDEAIKLACSMAIQGDIILIAGKGHEKYQEIQGVRHAFHDTEVVEKYLSKM